MKGKLQLGNLQMCPLLHEAALEPLARTVNVAGQRLCVINGFKLKLRSRNTEHRVRTLGGCSWSSLSQGAFSYIKTSCTREISCLSRLLNESRRSMHSHFRCYFENIKKYYRTSACNQCKFSLHLYTSEIYKDCF